jgi:two-component system response regulator PilR (NtrC family)
MERKKILVVDDEEDVRETLATVLENLNYQALLAADGEEALSVVKNQRVDVILSDLYMPGMNGIELLKRVKTEKKNIIFLMITAHPTIETAVDAIKKGAYDYLTKPFHIEEVRIKLSRAMEKQGLTHSLRWANGLIWALIISIPIWLILGIILASLLKD